MTDFELKREQNMTRHEAADRLRALAAALDAAGQVHIDLAGSTVKVQMPEQLSAELEIEIDGDEVELELELKWSRSRNGASLGPEERPASVPSKPTGPGE